VEKKVMPWENPEEEEDAIGKKKDEEELDDMDWLRSKQGLALEGNKEETNANKNDDDDEYEDEGYLKSDQLKQAEATAKIAETKRLFVRNLPIAISEEEIVNHCNQFGEVVECVLPLSKATKQPKGYALITFAAPHEALLAYAGLDGKIFGGRLLHAIAADAKKPAFESFEGKSGSSSSFKRQRDQEMARQDGGGGKNAIYIKTDTAVQLTAGRLGLEKADLLSAQAGGSMAVRAALAEAEVISDVKKFLESNGIVPEG
jgi:multiple RNA-binding domain-containing protein 1